MAIRPSQNKPPIKVDLRDGRFYLARREVKAEILKLITLEDCYPGDPTDFEKRGLMKHKPIKADAYVEGQVFEEGYSEGLGGWGNTPHVLYHSILYLKLRRT
jgi:hypothetical protein